MADPMRRRRQAVLGAACLAGAGVVIAGPLRPGGLVIFLAAVALLLGLAVLRVYRQESNLRRRDKGIGCTTYASVPGSGTFLLTLDETGLGLRGSSPRARRSPPEHYSWADVRDLSVERVGPLGSAGILTAHLPDRVLHASIGRVDEVIAAGRQHGAGSWHEVADEN